MNVLKDEAKNKLDKNQIYYITCRGGARGGMALGLLRKQGFNVINIEKGYMGMLNSGLTKIEKDPIYWVIYLIKLFLFFILPLL